MDFYNCPYVEVVPFRNGNEYDEGYGCTLTRTGCKMCRCEVTPEEVERLISSGEKGKYLMDRLTMESDKGGLAFTFDLDVTCERSEIEKIVRMGQKLKVYEDLQEQVEERIEKLKKSSDYPHNFKGQMVEDFEWVLGMLKPLN